MSKPVVLTFLGNDKDLDAAFKRVQANAARTNGSLAAMGKFSKGMTQVGKALTQYITLPVAAAGFGAVKLATDFQTSMTHIRTLVGASSKQVADWSKQILELAPKVGKSPRELADALYFITSSGIAAARAMGVLTFAAKASAAGLGDTRVVADTVTSAMNAYGQKVLSAKNATDVLLATVRDGKAEPEELARSLGRVVSPAALLGVTFRQVGAAVASMTDTGLDAFTSTTALRQIFVTLLKPAAQTSKEMDKLGLSAAGLRTELREKGLLATMETLKEKGAKNVAVFGKLFPNVRALNGFLSMMGPNLKQTQRIFKDLAHDGNDTNRAFEIASKTAGVKFHQALASLAVVGIQIGNDILPYVIDFAHWIAKLAQKFADLDPHTRKMIEQIALIAAAIGPVIFLLGKLGMGLTAIAKHPIVSMLSILIGLFLKAYATNKTFREDVDKVAGVLGKVGKALYAARIPLAALMAGFIAFRTVMAIQAVISGVATAFSILGGAMGALRAIIFNVRIAMVLLDAAFVANPIGIIIAALVALGVAFYILWTKCRTFRMVMVTMWIGILDAAKMAFDIIMSVLHGIVHGFDVVISHVPGIPHSIKHALKEADQAFGDFKKSVDGKLDGAITSAHLKSEALGVNIKEPIRQQVRDFQAIAEKYHTGIDAVLDAAGLSGKQKARLLGQFIDDGVIGGLNAKQRAVYSAAQGIATVALTGFKSKLRIASPSKETYQYGLWTSEGLAKGISNGAAGVMRVVNAQTRKLLAAYKDRLERVREAEQHLHDVMSGHFAGKGKHRHFVGPTPSGQHAAENRLRHAKDAAAKARKIYEQARLDIINTNKRRIAGKPLLGLADLLTQGLKDAFGHGEGPIEKIAASLSDAIQKQFADKNGKVPKAVQAAMDQLGELAQKAADFRSNLIDNLKGSGDLSNLIGQIDSEGNAVPVTSGSIKAFLGSQVAKLKQFAVDLGILGRKGVPADFLMQIAQGGLATGLPIAEALVNSSDADFQQILALQAQLNKLATRTGNMAESSIFSGGLRNTSVSGTADLGTTQTGGINITVIPQTNADPYAIANEISWALSTSGS